VKHVNQFLINIGSVARHPGARREIKLQGQLPDLRISFARVEENEPINLEAVLEQVYEGILVTGTLLTRWHGECRRCLGPAEGDLSADIRELYAEGMNDELVYEMAGDELDLEQLVHDVCILSLPLAPLCRTDCKGICPDCGVNLNTENCICVKGIDARWDKLSLLAKQDEN